MHGEDIELNASALRNGKVADCSIGTSLASQCEYEGDWGIPPHGLQEDGGRVGHIVHVSCSDFPAVETVDLFLDLALDVRVSGDNVETEAERERGGLVAGDDHGEDLGRDVDFLERLSGFFVVGGAEGFCEGLLGGDLVGKVFLGFLERRGVEGW